MILSKEFSTKFDNYQKKERNTYENYALPASKQKRGNL